MGLHLVVLLPSCRSAYSRTVLLPVLFLRAWEILPLRWPFSYMVGLHSGGGSFEWVVASCPLSYVCADRLRGSAMVG